MEPPPPRIKELAYHTMVRSGMEYAAPVWDPYLKKDTDKLEKVQRKAARFVLHRYQKTESVTALLEELGWSTLQERRKNLRLTLLFKILNDHVAVPPDELNIIRYNSRTRSANSMKLRQITTSTDQYKHSFVPRTIINWNSLSNDAVGATNIQGFKSALTAANTA